MADVEKIIGLSALNHYNDKINSVIDEKVGTGGLTIDSELSDTSINPVQGKAIKTELDKKADKSEIPTELPANGGNADTVNGHTVNANVPANAKFTDTVYALPTAGSTLGGVKTTSTVSSTSGLTACPIISGVPYYKDTDTTYDISGYAIKTDIPTSLPANGGNADMVDGVHAWNMHTLAAGGGSHGSGNHLMYCKHNVLGNGKFYIGVTDGYERAVAVNYAENADSVDDIHIHCINDGAVGTSWFAVFGATNDIRAIDPARAYVGSSGGVTCSLIGTGSGCQYSTILAWANAQTTTTFASIVAGAGIPSDAPYQQEALLQVQVDYYLQRKIVTWTRYLGGQAPQIRQRAIFGTAWNDSEWRVVCG